MEKLYSPWGQHCHLSAEEWGFASFEWPETENTSNSKLKTAEERMKEQKGPGYFLEVDSRPHGNRMRSGSVEREQPTA
jgi:hypothetical protein